MQTAVQGARAQDDYARFKMKYNFNRYPTNSKLHFGFISVRLDPTKFKLTLKALSYSITTVTAAVASVFTSR